MQALKDAGVVLAVITLALSVRVTKIEPIEGETEAALLASPAHAAAPAQTALPARGNPEVPDFDRVRAEAEAAVQAMPQLFTVDGVEAIELQAEVVERCAQIVLELRDGAHTAQQYVMVVEAETEDGKRAPCPRT